MKYDEKKDEKITMIVFIFVLGSFAFVVLNIICDLLI